jgi:aminoglycoside phosphotransferase family enzyme
MATCQGVYRIVDFRGCRPLSRDRAAIKTQAQKYGRLILVGDLIEDLLRPEALPHPTANVQLVQTHISLVFVGDEFVYKIKKPVDFGFLNFTTPELRLHFCQEEVRLNRRLSPDMYLGVLSVVFDGKSHTLRETPGGKVVDYAVWMKRIPQDRLMKSLLARGELGEAHLRELAFLLARFAAEAETSPEIAKFGEPDRFRVNTEENFAQTEPYIGRTIEPGEHLALKRWTHEFYEQREGLFMERIRQGRIRDCHGDLHMEHICFAEQLCIFDCIEFNDRFRYSDTLSDIAFLLMDLEFHGAWDMAARLWDLYGEMAGERNVQELLKFYKVYRAFVRGKVNGFRLEDPHIPEQQKAEAAQEARRYFKLAMSYIG